MELQLNNLPAYEKALTTPWYCEEQRKSYSESNTSLTGHGSDLLGQQIEAFILHGLGIQLFPKHIMARSLSDVELAPVFDEIKTTYQFKTKEASPGFMKNARTAEQTVKANLVKSIANIAYYHQPEVFEDIVQRIGAKISVKGDAAYKMKVLVYDAGDGFLKNYLSYFNLRDDRGPLFKAILNYQVVREALGESKSIALQNVCALWLNEHKIEY